MENIIFGERLRIEKKSRANPSSILQFQLLGALPQFCKVPSVAPPSPHDRNPPVTLPSHISSVHSPVTFPMQLPFLPVTRGFVNLVCFVNKVSRYFQLSHGEEVSG